MPFSVGETVDNFANDVLKAPMVRAIVKNPIYTALTIAFILILIVMFVFRDADTDESLLTMSLRTGFWAFLAMLGVLFLHNKVLINENNEEREKADYGGIFNTSYSGAVEPRDVARILEDSVLPVHIDTEF